MNGSTAAHPRRASSKARSCRAERLGHASAASIAAIPTSTLLERLLEPGGVTEITLAPELPGASALSSAGCSTAASSSPRATRTRPSEEADEAFDLGVSTATHLFNAMRPFRSRDPGVIGVALTRRDVFVQLIVDGHHLADETVRLVWAAAGHRTALVTDATAGAAERRRHLPARRRGDRDRRTARPLREDGVLAGTVLTMIDAVRNVHALGIRFEDAIAAATAVPARILGRTDVGVLEPGGPADVVVLDDRLDIVDVLCAGGDHVVARD